MPTETLRRRLLLALFAVGTNAGIRRVASSEPGTDTESDLHCIRRRYLTPANPPQAITTVVNAIHAARHEHHWGHVTTTASDSTKFGAWDQNLLTEWHTRYRGPGVMIYWPLDRKSLCVYSQLKSCSSSEVAAMIEGLLRHQTDVEIDGSHVNGGRTNGEVAATLRNEFGVEVEADQLVELVARIEGQVQDILRRDRFPGARWLRRQILNSEQAGIAGSWSARIMKYQGWSWVLGGAGLTLMTVAKRASPWLAEDLSVTLVTGNE